MSEERELELLKRIETLEKEKEDILLEKTRLAETNEQLLANEEEMRQLSEIIYSQRVLLEKKSEELEEKSLKIMDAYNQVIEKEHELRELNSELEKLSIVASETDNGVSIFNANYDLIWVNTSFTRLYGYTLEDFIDKVGCNIFQISSNPKIRKIVSECIENKISVNYQTQTVSSDLRLIWTQTTLTPILDTEHNVTKLIAIESDICKLKQAELEIENQKNELEIKNDLLRTINENINASIRYAQTIQQALLPDLKKLSTYETFIIFKPRDIVSGDFYWFTQIIENLVVYDFFAVVDCTGHGVPGAFMSMIGNSLLNEIVNEKRILATNKILDILNFRIIGALNQEITANTDGMDVCLVRIEKSADDFEINFSGAKRPLFYYSSEKKEVKQISGDRRSIGGIIPKQKYGFFNSTSLKLKKGDIIYLSSDGYVDQNSFDRKRIGTPRFVQIISDNSGKSMIEQQNEYETFITEYKKEEEQRDDITVLGIKL